MEVVGEYVVRCMVCGHKVGTTLNQRETLDVCSRCDREDA